MKSEQFYSFKSSETAFEKSYLVWLLSIALFLSVSVFGWFMWHIYHSYQTQYEMQKRMMKMTELRVSLTKIDEILSASVEMSVETRDLSTESEYRKFEPQLNEIIQRAINSAPDSEIQKSVEKINQANQRLVELEHRVLNLVRERRLEEARTILQSAEYLARRKDFEAGLRVFDAAVKEYEQQRLSEISLQNIKSVAAVIIIFAVSIWAWLAVIYTLQRSRRLLLHQIDKERNALEALNKSEARFRELFENASDIVFTTDLEGRFTSFNKEGEKLTGYDRQEINSLKIEDVIESEQPELLRNLLGEKSEADAVKYNAELIAKNGARLAVEISSRVIFEDGKPIGIQSIARNLTERLQMTEALKKSEQYQNLFKHANDAILILEPETEIVLNVNDKACELYGIKCEDFIGLSLKSISKHGKNKTKEIRELLESGVYQEFETVQFRSDGTPLYLLVNASIIEYEGERAILSINRDITERHRAEIERQVIFDISEGVNTTANLDALLKLIHRSIGKVLNAENCFVALYDKKTELLNMQFFVDKYDEMPPPFKLGKGLTATVFRNHRPMLMNREVIQHLSEKGEIELAGTPPATWLGVPLITHNEIIGVLVVQSYEDESAYSARDLEFLSSVGNQIATAIERKRAEAEVQKNLSLLTSTFEATADGILVVDRNNNIVTYNKQFIEMWQIPEHIINTRQNEKTLNHVVSQLTNAQEFLETTKRLVAHPETKNYDILKCKDGKIYERYSHPQILDGKVVGRVISFRNITERKQVEEALTESEYKLRTLLESMNEGLVQVNNDDTIEFVNDRFCEMTGYRRVELIGKIGYDIFLDLEGRRIVDEVNKERLQGVSSHYELCIRKKSGERMWTIVGGAPIINAEGIVTGTMGVFTDITERKIAEERLLHDALHDNLTGLANRKLFINHLQKAIERGKRNEQSSYAVLFLDFDRFKVINDSLGHAAGDSLLIQIARRLESSLRSGDLLARLGGDEFTILLNELRETDDAVQVAERIHNDLNIPFIIGEQEIFMSASIGIALGNGAHNSADDMLRDADIAMYRAKSKGKAQHQIFDQAMHKYAINKLQLETEMHHALQRGEFSLYYQPIINLETNNLIGFEALVRWEHPERGMVPPNEFIPMAEENGLVIPLGRWILYESCRQLREWQLNNPWMQSLTMSVNLSCKQFLQNDLIEQVIASLVSTQLEPRCLKLEITESHLMENSQMSVTALHRLKECGVELCLDDFGTGYSSLSYLHRLPVSFLKVDRSFITRMIESRENREIVQTIIKLAQNLKMKVIAEGIESVDQFMLLKQLGCEYGQGYLISAPLDGNKAGIFISKQFENAHILAEQSIINAELNM
jgi:diguanylate cyclase (GGDEF)-like protein/PAS domain S-box-containing protein